jgi:hypothetical protein
VLCLSLTLLAQGTDNKIIFEDPERIQALERRCDALERSMEILKSIFDTYENCIESYRKEIVRLHKVRGTLNTCYEGESYDLVQSGTED